MQEKKKNSKSISAKNYASDRSTTALTLFRAGGGGGHIVPPPPQVNFPKYLKNALSYRVETFWLFKWTNCQKKYLVFNCLRPPLVTIATPKVDACFRTTYFNSFHAKTPQNSKVFCYIFEGCPNWNLLWKFGLNIPLDGVLVRVFVSHSFRCFNDLKMNTTTTMATPKVSFDLVFHKLSEKGYFFLLLLRGTRFLIFKWWFLVKNLKNMNHLKTITMVSMETKFASQDSILDKLSEKN